MGNDDMLDKLKRPHLNELVGASYSMVVVPTETSMVKVAGAKYKGQSLDQHRNGPSAAHLAAAERAGRSECAKRRSAGRRPKRKTIFMTKGGRLDRALLKALCKLAGQRRDGRIPPGSSGRIAFSMASRKMICVVCNVAWYSTWRSAV